MAVGNLHCLWSCTWLTGAFWAEHRTKLPSLARLNHETKNWHPAGNWNLCGVLAGYIFYTFCNCNSDDTTCRPSSVHHFSITNKTQAIKVYIDVLCETGCGQHCHHSPACISNVANMCLFMCSAPILRQSWLCELSILCCYGSTHRCTYLMCWLCWRKRVCLNYTI